MRRTATLRERSLWALLAGEVISTTGGAMTFLALPWFVLVTTGSAGRMAFVMAAELAGVALFGIPGGAVSARLGARRTMLVADAARAPLMAAIPVFNWTGLLSFPALLGLVFAVGAFAAPYFAAQRVIVPELLGEDKALVAKANALLEGATRLTFLLGPALAGLLIGFIGATNVLFVDAATYAVSCTLVGLFVPSRAAVPVAGEDRRLLVGLRFIVRDRLLRVWTASFAIGDTAWQALFATLPVLAFVRYGGDAKVAGWLLAAFGGGSIIGNLVTLRIIDSVDGLLVASLAAVGQALSLWVLAFTVPALVVGTALFCSGVWNGLANPPLHSIMTMRPPPSLRPQVMTAMLTADVLLGPLGLVAAGPALDRFGTRPVLVAVVAAQTAAMLALASAGLRTRREERVTPVLV